MVAKSKKRVHQTHEIEGLIPCATADELAYQIHEILSADRTTCIDGEIVHPILGLIKLSLENPHEAYRIADRLQLEVVGKLETPFRRNS